MTISGKLTSPFELNLTKIRVKINYFKNLKSFISYNHAYKKKSILSFNTCVHTLTCDTNTHTHAHEAEKVQSAPL